MRYSKKTTDFGKFSAKCLGKNGIRKTQRILRITFFKTIFGGKCKFTFEAVHKLESYVEEPGKPTQKIPTKNCVKGGSASRKFKKVLTVGEHTL